MKNVTRVSVSLNTFRKLWPNLPDNTTIFQCENKVCKLPFGGQIELEQRFVVEIGNKSYIVNAASIIDTVAYFLEEL